ncbi:DNA-protecting protein DprA [bacterium]|nr:DNA-protecting protein DprA [bacterium]
MKATREEWIARRKLNSTPGIGFRLQKRLYDQYGSALSIQRAVLNQSLRVEGIGSSKLERLVSHLAGGNADHSAHDASLVARPSRKDTPREEMNESETGSMLGYSDSDYPDLLRHISDPPPYFWVKGQGESLQMPCVAVVGTRRASAYGRRTAHRLAFELARSGICVVSGLAYGIDRAAHEGALDAGGKTIAVLGSGVHQIYPREHRALAQKIEKQGCIVSEFEPQTRPERTHFPQRNRIISGLSRATIVVEAFEKAGALVTAALCIDQKRDLYAVPGRIDDATSSGTNALLEASAAAVLTRPEQIITEMRSRGWLSRGGTGAEERVETPPVLPRSKLENQILDCLSTTHRHIDEIEACLEYPDASLWTALLQLECDGLIHALEGNYYERTSAL